MGTNLPNLDRVNRLNSVDGPTMAKAKVVINSVDHLGEIVQQALKRAGMSDKEAAYLMGIDPPRFSRQLAGKEPLSFARMCERLPASFWQELICLLGPYCGFTVKREITLSEEKRG